MLLTKILLHAVTGVHGFCTSSVANMAPSALPWVSFAPSGVQNAKDPITACSNCILNAFKPAFFLLLIKYHPFVYTCKFMFPLFSDYLSWFKIDKYTRIVSFRKINYILGKHVFITWTLKQSPFSPQTNLPVFKQKDSSVRRRYSDFEWLRNELERDSKVCLVYFIEVAA